MHSTFLSIYFWLIWFTLGVLIFLSSFYLTAACLELCQSRYRSQRTFVQSEAPAAFILPPAQDEVNQLHPSYATGVPVNVHGTPVIVADAVIIGRAE